MSDYRWLQGATRLDLQPIEREEVDDSTVKYLNIKLIDEGVWTDENSQTPTLYDTETFENTDPESGEYDGPPVNIHHDLAPDGEPNDASVGGYIEPESLSTDGKALFGDLVLDLDDPAGAFADQNLQSSLESNGEVGFSPSVELTPTEFSEDVDHPRAEEHVTAAKLTGLGLVRDPASKSVDFAHETRNREVALSSDSQNVKVLSKVDDGMSDAKQLQIGEEELSGIIGGAHQDAFDSITDLYEAAEDSEAFAGGLSDILDNAQDTILENAFEGDDEEGEEDTEARENAEEDYDDKDEDDEEAEMAENMDPEEMMSAIQALRERMEELEAEHEAMMSEAVEESELAEAKEELSESIEETKAELAAAETVKEIEKTLSETQSRVEKIAEEPNNEDRTLADDTDFDWSNSDSGVQYDPTTGSTY